MQWEVCVCVQRHTGVRAGLSQLAARFQHFPTVLFSSPPVPLLSFLSLPLPSAYLPPPLYPEAAPLKLARGSERAL